MDANYIRERITELRLEKGVSEHKMSLDLGHARSYIHGIVTGRTLPSMSEFLSICDYLEISPEFFFDESRLKGIQLSRLMKYAEHLSETDIKILVELAERLRDR